MVTPTSARFLLLAFVVNLVSVCVVDAAGASRVLSIKPNEGSLSGATRIIISGEGFSVDPFSYGQGNLHKGNQVYLKNDFSSYPCDVIPYYCNQERIVCDTRSYGTDGTFSVFVIVDGNPVEKYCDRKDDCRFRFDDDQTPSIEQVTPSSGVPGSKVSIRGKIITSRYDPSPAPQGDAVETEGKDQILRIYWGNYACDPFDPTTGKLYNIALDEPYNAKGVIECVPKGTYVASQLITYLISNNYGRSRSETSALSVSAKNKLYHFQTHADVLNVEPIEGSLEGGTVLTITGRYFDGDETSVLVGGVPCKILEVNATQIQCVTGQASAPQNLYPGDRGMMYEIWNNTESPLPDVIWDTNADNYFFVSVPKASSPDEHQFGEDGSFVGRLKGFFVPPRTGDYQFKIISDDESKLYFSLTGDPNDKTEIAFLDAANGDWNSNNDQVSDKISLTANQSYYLEAVYRDLGGPDFVQIGVVFFDVPLSKADFSGAENEVQEIQTTSVVMSELQTLTVEGATFEVQEIAIRASSCLGGVCTYKLQFGQNLTGDLSILASADEMEAALNLLVYPDAVAVTMMTASDTTTYAVEFQMTRSDIPLLIAVKDDASLDITITKTVPFSPITLNGFKILVDNITSSDLSSSSTADEVQSALLEVFSVKCEIVREVSGYYAQGFEVGKVGFIDDDIIWDEEAYCGRASVKNPNSLFLADRTLDPGTSKPLKEFDVRYNNQLCFAHRGKLQNKIALYQHWMDNDNTDHYNWQTYKDDDLDLSTESWRFTCVDIGTIVTKSWFYNQHKPGSPLKINRIQLKGYREQDFFVDNIYIGNGIPQYERVRPPAKPNGILVSDISVRKRGYSFDVTLTSAKCGYGYPLLSIQGAVQTLDGNDRATYTDSGWPPGISITVTRQDEATRPIQGTFDLSVKQDGVSIQVPSDATSNKLKELIESHYDDVGILDVRRDGTCAGYSWRVEWTSKGGRQPLMQVNGDSLTGNMVDISSRRSKEGKLLMGPIPGEFLRAPYDKPQVEVFVNGIPSSCSGRLCAFEFTEAATAEVLTSAPSSGSSGTSLTLTGRRFSVTPDNNIVTIGGVRCVITSASESSLTCTIGDAEAGIYNISLEIAGKGLAKFTNGPLTLQYNIDVTAINPSSGSTAGGSRVTITGSAFGMDKDDVVVSVGSQACLIESVTSNEIQCVIAYNEEAIGSSLLVDVTVTVNGQSKVLSGAYTFNPAMTPSINDFNPKSSGVKGGDELSISGEGFGTSGANVTIGGENCELTSQSDSEVTCILPEHSPGTYNVEVAVTGQGYANATGLSFQYQLDVTGLFPDHGSLRGGTVLTVTGAGFGTNASDVSVILGDINCKVTSVDNDAVMCVTGTSEATHKVDNSGKHELYGLGYKWNPQILTITAGDVVAWKWTTLDYVTGIRYSVQQTADADSVSYNGQGFHSGTPTPNGQFANRFTKPGTYYYSSGLVNEGGDVYMKGIVIVREATSSSHRLNVEVSGHTALQDTSSGISAPASPDACPGSNTTIPGCYTPVTPGEDTSHFYFAYWICSTPVISKTTPNEGDSSTLVTIQGSGFSSVSCENEVYIGDYSCIVQTSSSTELTCLIDPAENMTVGEPRIVSVTVRNRGLALNQILSPAEQGFTLKPQIDSMSIHEGSVSGGTKITITGVGFAADSASDVSLWIGDRACLVQTISYTEIVCITADTSTQGRRRRREAGTPDLTLEINSQPAVCKSDCSFNFDVTQTPQVDGITPVTVTGSSTSITITGSKFSTDTDSVTVAIGEVECIISSAAVGGISCDVGYVPAGTREVLVNIAGKGNAMFSVANTVTSTRAISSISPSLGSKAGGQMITISGNGFVVGDTVVEIDGQTCDVETVSLAEVTCKTRAHDAGSVSLVVTTNGGDYPVQSYEYSDAVTPMVSSVTPPKGKTGDVVTISGSGFGSDPSLVTVSLDGASCSISNLVDDSITCTLGDHSAGTYRLMVLVAGKGLSLGSVDLEYELILSSISPAEGSLGGGQVMSIDGTGFDDTVSVSVCDNSCSVIRVDSASVNCEVPSNPGSGDVVCDVTVSLASGATATDSGAFTYRTSLTPVIDSIEPRRGGTAGGTRLTITGSGFLASGNVVTISGRDCIIETEAPSQIVCVTEAHGQSEKTKVRVKVDPNGIATQTNADFYYIDVWSSHYTWSGNPPPTAGQFVIVPAGQTLLLDQTTPILSMLLIQGGSLIFDEKDLELHAENILIVDGGLLQIGTEEEPFQHQATITMHGHVRSTELPLFGAKTLAIRNGTLDLHGQRIPVTWTRLAETAVQGAVTIRVEHEVTWKAGDEVVIATTGYRHSLYENEKVTLTGVSSDGRDLTFTPALRYDHFGISQVIDGVELEMRAEVGLLTRNVKVRGSVQEEWLEDYDACPEDFNTGQFATQTCFLGKLGEETGSDQFGSQIMFFAVEEQQIKGRIEYVEVTHAGQAFRLGRYPIHFHMSGDVTGSYVRGCGIHNTFNRAVTIHGTHNLHVEHNVAYEIMGHAFFMEDGIETGNTIEYNLGMYVRPSSSLLNVDITPAAFWITNPDNIVRHNAAAGGSHFGFWYNMPTHPEGPSFTPSICPRNVPLREFRNNTAHAQGWYGLWVFPTYHPKQGGGCSAQVDEPAIFDSLYAWETERGAEAVEVGAVQFHNFVISDAEMAGVEYQQTMAPWGEDGALIKDLVVVAYSQISEARKAKECTEAGIRGPQLEGLTVHGAKFINFDQDRCAALAYCSKCRINQGGYSVRLKGLEFFNSPNKAAFEWEHECWFEDLDGSLTGTPNHIVLPSNPNLPPAACSADASYSLGLVPGSSCDDTVHLHRLAFNNASPSSLLRKSALFTNAHGTSVVPYLLERLTHPEGWMVTLINGENYNMSFQDVGQVTNTTYDATFYGYKDGDYVLISHVFTQIPDSFAINGQIRNSTENVPTYEGNQNADFHFEEETRTLTYLVSGKGESTAVDYDIHPNVYRCYYEDCLVPDVQPPPEVRPDDFKLWSDVASWDSGSLPADGDDVTIPASVWMVADMQLPTMNKLTIYGGLEIEDTRDNKLEATYILIHGGRLVVGFSADAPFQHNMRIVLNGHHLTPDHPLPNGPNLGAKSLGVFGGLDFHGIPHPIYWTQLAAPVSPGDSTLTVTDQTDWKVGDEIVVATTSYEAWQTETFRIEAVMDPSTFQINGTFAFKHIAHYTADYILAAEVGLLTRNIRIEGNEYDGLFRESFGARVLVGQFFQEGVEYKGHARFSNVQFYHTGQEGWPDYYDPRYSLAFLDVGVVTEALPSWIKGCSFHSGFSPAIGVYGTNGLLVMDNVVHHTVGPGVIVWGEGNQLIHNLVTLVVFPGTYQDRFEQENFVWNAGIEIDKADDIVLINNTVAGSERVAFKIKGEKCDGAATWSGNVAHSTLHGIHLFLTSQPECTTIANFLVYKSWDFGVYYQIKSSVRMTGLTLVDNKVAVMPLVIGPNALTHQTADIFTDLENSIIVGVSDSFDCTADAVEPENAPQSQAQRGPRAPGQGHAGFVWATFVSSVNLAPKFAFHQAVNYPTINGISRLEHVIFRGFGEHCGKTDVAIMTNPASENAQHPMVTSHITLDNVDDRRKVYIHRPNVCTVNPSDCVDMDCDGLKKAMISDLDGSLLGSSTPGTVIPQSEYEWNGDPRRGLGDYRIPKAMLTRPDGSKIPVEEKAPNKGIYRGNSNQCSWIGDWQAYNCLGIDHMMLVVESLDADTEVRRISPVAVYSNGYVDLINGPMDHGWCNGYTCQERISTFNLIIASMLEYELYFTGTNPQTTRFHLLNAAQDQAAVMGVWYMKPQRLDVYYQNRYVIPNNADFSTGELIWKPKDPSMPADQYNPSLTSGVPGENYFERDTQTLWVLVKGPEPVEIRTTAVVMVSFGVPAVSVDDFYENGNLVKNLAALLKVDESQIRVVDVIREAGKRRRRRQSDGEGEVTVEIGPQPLLEIEAPDSPLTTSAPTTASSESEVALDFEGLQMVASQLANAMQSGELAEYFGVVITGMTMTEPVPKAVDPTHGIRATNETGGSPDVPEGTKPYDEVMREEEEKANSLDGVQIEYRTPDHMLILTQPDGAAVGEVFEQQPSVYVVDSSGNLIPQLGAPSNPWQLTASVSPSSPDAAAVRLAGKLTVPFEGSWANFTNLTIADESASGRVILDFKITYLTPSVLDAISSSAFDVVVLPTKRIQLRFLADYDQVASGKEALLQTAFLDYAGSKYDSVKLRNVYIQKGSILISFDMKGDDVDEAIKALWTDIQTGQFILEFDGHTLTADDDFMLVDGRDYGPVDVPVYKGLPGWAIALVVIFTVATILSLLLIACRMVARKGPKLASPDDIPLTEQVRSHFPGSNKACIPLIEVDSETDDPQFNSLSDMRSRNNSPRRTPEIEITSLPPGFTEATGQEERFVDERTEMVVQIKNPNKTLQNLCTVQANKAGTIRALRADIEGALPGKLQGKNFVLLDKYLRDIDGILEETVTLIEMYQTNDVVIRWVEEDDECKLCVCGLVGQYQCSLCHRQAYCSPMCQSSDWINHSKQCGNVKPVSQGYP